MSREGSGGEYGRGGREKGDDGGGGEEEGRRRGGMGGRETGVSWECVLTFVPVSTPLVTTILTCEPCTGCPFRNHAWVTMRSVQYETTITTRELHVYCDGTPNSHDTRSGKQLKMRGCINIQPMLLLVQRAQCHETISEARSSAGEEGRERVREGGREESKNGGVGTRVVQRRVVLRGEPVTVEKGRAPQNDPPRNSSTGVNHRFPVLLCSAVLR